MSIETLKEQARRHEQKEEWLKALDQYKKAIHRLEAEDQPDIGLYNRVGDLYVRVGRLDDAVEHYGRAVDLYMESGLPNNAIAVCKKIIRNVPDRHDAYLRMGQIRAQQGFLPDARTNFLTYAERMQQVGDLDESFRALVEFCDLAPDDFDVRIAVADQMALRGRVGDAVGQLSVAYHALMGKGETMSAFDIETKIRELDPDADLSAVMEPTRTADELVFGSGVGEDAEIVDSYGDIEVGASFPADTPDETAAFDFGGDVLDVSSMERDLAGEDAPGYIDEQEEEAGGERDDEDAAGEEAASEEEAPVAEAASEEKAPVAEAVSEEEAPVAEDAVDFLADLPVSVPFAGIEEQGEAISEEEYAEEVYAEQADEPFELPLMEFDDEEIGEVVHVEEGDEAEGFELPLIDFETELGEVGEVEEEARRKKRRSPSSFR